MDEFSAICDTMEGIFSDIEKNETGVANCRFQFFLPILPFLSFFSFRLRDFSIEWAMNKFVHIYKRRIYTYIYAASINYVVNVE